MANTLDSVTLIAPISDPEKQGGQNFIMSLSYAVTGGGKPPTVNLYWEYRYNGTFYPIPITADGLHTDSNEEIGAGKDTQYDRTIECRTQGIYYVRARAYDTTNSIERVSAGQVVTVLLASAYYHGLKIQGVGELALCDVGNNPLRLRKGGVTYGIELVATGDPNASTVRIKTPSGVKAIRNYT